MFSRHNMLFQWIDCLLLFITHLLVSLKVRNKNKVIPTFTNIFTTFTHLNLPTLTQLLNYCHRIAKTLPCFYVIKKQDKVSSLNWKCPWQEIHIKVKMRSTNLAAQPSNSLIVFLTELVWLEIHLSHPINKRKSLLTCYEIHIWKNPSE